MKSWLLSTLLQQNQLLMFQRFHDSFFRRRTIPCRCSTRFCKFPSTSSGSFCAIWLELRLFPVRRGELGTLGDVPSFHVSCKPSQLWLRCSTFFQDYQRCPLAAMCVASTHPPKSRISCLSGSRCACVSLIFLVSFGLVSCPDTGMLRDLHKSFGSVLCF